MKTFEVILTIEASDCTTEKDVQKSLELIEGDVTGISVSELEVE